MNDLPPGWPHTSAVSRRRKAVRAPWDADRKKRFTELWLEGAPVELIADELETSRGAIYQQRQKLGLPPRSPGTGRGQRKVPSDATGLRRHSGVKPGSGRQINLNPLHPALRNGSTIHGQTVVGAAAARSMLKSASDNRKIGSPAVKGRWAGMPIYTLTLEERATCPRECKAWTICYGNNMGHMSIERIHDDGWLMPRLRVEIAHYSAIHPRGFIIRPHILGDFFSPEYVKFWDEHLTEFPALHIFGFTARQPDSEIGRAVLEMMARHLDQVAMRVSGHPGDLHTAEFVGHPKDAAGLICPAQMDEERCCANCGLCWQSERKISFIEHGSPSMKGQAHADSLEI